MTETIDVADLLIANIKNNLVLEKNKISKGDFLNLDQLTSDIEHLILLTNKSKNNSDNYDQDIDKIKTILNELKDHLIEEKELVREKIDELDQNLYAKNAYLKVNS